MEAVRGLQHRCIHFLHFSLSNLSVTEFAKFIFFILLHLFVVRLGPFSLSMVHELFKSVSIYFFLSFWVWIHRNLFIHIHVSIHRKILIIVHFIFFYLLHFFTMISHKAVGSQLIDIICVATSWIYCFAWDQLLKNKFDIGISFPFRWRQVVVRFRLSILLLHHAIKDLDELTVAVLLHLHALKGMLCDFYSTCNLSPTRAIKHLIASRIYLLGRWWVSKRKASLISCRIWVHRLLDVITVVIE